MATLTPLNVPQKLNPNCNCHRAC